jgi:hypothetical protein
MQSAYVEYQRASEALESPWPSDEDPQGALTPLAGRQRVAFERYLEARMEFLEGRYDDSYPPGPRFAVKNVRPYVWVLAALLLCTAAFAVVRTRNHIRDLEASRDDLQARLNQTRAGLEVLAQKVDTWQPAPAPPAIVQPAPVRRTRTTTVRPKAKRPPMLRVQQKRIVHAEVDRQHTRRRG